MSKPALTAEALAEGLGRLYDDGLVLDLGRCLLRLPGREDGAVLASARLTCDYLSEPRRYVLAGENAVAMRDFWSELFPGPGWRWLELEVTTDGGSEKLWLCCVPYSRTGGSPAGDLAVYDSVRFAFCDRPRREPPTEAPRGGT